MAQEKLQGRFPACNEKACEYNPEGQASQHSIVCHILGYIYDFLLLVDVQVNDYLNRFFFKSKVFFFFLFY